MNFSLMICFLPFIFSSSLENLSIDQLISKTENIHTNYCQKQKEVKLRNLYYYFIFKYELISDKVCDSMIEFLEDIFDNYYEVNQSKEFKIAKLLYKKIRSIKNNTFFHFDFFYKEIALMNQQLRKNHKTNYLENSDKSINLINKEIDLKKVFVQKILSNSRIIHIDNCLEKNDDFALFYLESIKKLNILKNDASRFIFINLQFENDEQFEKFADFDINILDIKGNLRKCINKIYLKLGQICDYIYEYVHAAKTIVAYTDQIEIEFNGSNHTLIHTEEVSKLRILRKNDFTQVLLHTKIEENINFIFLEFENLLNKNGFNNIEKTCFGFNKMTADESEEDIEVKENKSKDDDDEEKMFLIEDSESNSEESVQESNKSEKMDNEEIDNEFFDEKSTQTDFDSEESDNCSSEENVNFEEKLMQKRKNMLC